MQLAIEINHLFLGTLQEYQKRMKKLDQQYKERIRNAELFLQLETDQVEKNYVKEKKAAAKEFEDKKIELKENLIAELEEKKKMIENEKLTMELTGDSMEVKPIMTRKLRRRPNDPVPIPDKRRKPAPAQLNYLLTDEQIMEDLRTLNKLKSPKRPASPSSPEHLPATPAESPAQRFEARIEDGKLYYDKRWYHKSQAIYLESKENTKISCVISSVGANEECSVHLSFRCSFKRSCQTAVSQSPALSEEQEGKPQLEISNLGEENQRQHKDEDLSGTAAARCFRHPSAIGCVTLGGSHIPVTDVWTWIWSGVLWLS
uniref:SDS3 homolog, SIN3A corepressor complex component n=1 Tax=Pavo cristatus TaxID=9049 RepID=A0A8C9EYZ7_PAVCR